MFQWLNCDRMNYSVKFMILQIAQSLLDLPTSSFLFIHYLQHGVDGSKAVWSAATSPIFFLASRALFTSYSYTCYTFTNREVNQLFVTKNWREMKREEIVDREWKRNRAVRMEMFNPFKTEGIVEWDRNWKRRKWVTDEWKKKKKEERIHLSGFLSWAGFSFIFHILLTLEHNELWEGTCYRLIPSFLLPFLTFLVFLSFLRPHKHFPISFFLHLRSWRSRSRPFINQGRDHQVNPTLVLVKRVRKPRGTNLRLLSLSISM